MHRMPRFGSSTADHLRAGRRNRPHDFGRPPFSHDSRMPFLPCFWSRVGPLTEVARGADSNAPLTQTSRDGHRCPPWRERPSFIYH